MEEKRIRYIVLRLEHYELTVRERQFVEAVENYFRKYGRVTDQQESILYGIYREKIWARKAFFGGSDVSKDRPLKSRLEITL